MSSSEGANLALRFILEMATLAALAFFGFVTFIPLGIILPLIGVFVWGTFVAPRARRRLEDPARLVVEIAFFASGVVALALAGVIPAAAILAVAVIAHIGLMLAYKQR
jgi:hypothetical protein